MILLKSHIKTHPIGLLPDGLHSVRIESVAETFTADKNMPWDDRTPQISIRYKNTAGYITHWINVMGYMTNEDYFSAPIGVIFKAHPYSKIQYAVDFFTNKRIENVTKTETCLRILSRIGYCGGIPQDRNFTLADLVGLELGISVVNSKVIKTFKKV